MDIGTPDLTINIAGTFNVGGGPFSYHTEYQLQIQYKGESWTIYRRYAHFIQLHAKLLQLLGGDEENSILPKLPEKSLLGSYFSTSNSVVNQRKIALKAYLDDLLKLNDEPSLNEILSFADIDGHGVSGACKEFGKNSILKENFAKTKVGSFVNLWSINFLVLLKDGRLFVFHSIYDGSTKAIQTWNLKGGEIRVIPKANDNKIVISSLKDDKKLQLSFPTAAEAAFWMRTVADFSLMSSQQVISNVKATAAAAKASSTPQKPVVENKPVVNVKAAGTGNTADDLSSMYGI